MTEDEAESPNGFTRFALSIDDIAEGAACRVHLHLEHDRRPVDGTGDDLAGDGARPASGDVAIGGSGSSGIGGGSGSGGPTSVAMPSSCPGHGCGAHTVRPLWMPGTSSSEITSLFCDGLAVISANTSRGSGGKDPVETLRDLKKRLATGALVRMVAPSSTVGRVNDLLASRKRSPHAGALSGGCECDHDAVEVEVLRKKHWLSVYLDRPVPFDIDPNLIS